jgi:hypothetical protein
MLGAVIILSILTECSVPRSGDILARTATSIQNDGLHENTTEISKVTRTPQLIGTELSATLQPVATATTATVTTGPMPTHLPTLPPEIPILPPDGSRAAANLQSTAECDRDEPWKGVAQLNWTVSANRGSEQRVIVTVYRDGFETGRFDTSGSLSSDQSSLAWEQLSPGIIHFWIVLTRHEDGWVPSEQSSFEAPVCAVDFISTPTP